MVSKIKVITDLIKTLNSNRAEAEEEAEVGEAVVAAREEDTKEDSKEDKAAVEDLEVHVDS